MLIFLCTQDIQIEMNLGNCMWGGKKTKRNWKEMQCAFYQPIGSGKTKIMG